VSAQYAWVRGLESYASVGNSGSDGTGLDPHQGSEFGPHGPRLLCRPWRCVDLQCRRHGRRERRYPLDLALEAVNSPWVGGREASQSPAELQALSEGTW